MPTSVRRLMRAAMAAGLTALLPPGLAQANEEMPDIAFLEYLGSWEGSDEDWLLVDAAEGVDEQWTEVRTDPVPDGEESVESDDENE